MKSASDTYQKMTPIEHILKRPDTYIGSVSAEKGDLYLPCLDPAIVFEKRKSLYRSEPNKSSVSQLNDQDSSSEEDLKPRRRNKDTKVNLQASLDKLSFPRLDESSLKMKRRCLSYVPAFMKIFDEILVNAADNKVRDPKMSIVSIIVNHKANRISILNDGNGIPVEMHKKEKVMIPEMIFGQLLTSSNYDDSVSKVTGGRNGYGAKLTNLYSKEFRVSTKDSSNGKEYEQIWRNNMMVKDPASISSFRKFSETTKATLSAFSEKLRSLSEDSKEDSLDSVNEALKEILPEYTEISFVPDFKRFGMDQFSNLTAGDFSQYYKKNAGASGKVPASQKSPKPKKLRESQNVEEDFCDKTELVINTLLLIFKRAIDLAGTAQGQLAVFLNGVLIPIFNFADYCRLYIKDVDQLVVHNALPRWQVAVTASDGQFCSVSFVNSIATTGGGRHVAHVADIITDQIADEFDKIKDGGEGGTRGKKTRSATKKKPAIKSQLFVFVNSLIENPSFKSQTKEFLSSDPKFFGSSFAIDKDFSARLLKTRLYDQIKAYLKYKDEVALKKGDGKKSKNVFGIKKLNDAQEAGGAKSRECALILTEGDSAKALAVAGIEVVKNEFFGVYPLKGKLLNVREAPKNILANNKEIEELKKIIGLKTGLDYSESLEGDKNFGSLRYGKVIIMADQDLDGSHIKGLVINFFHFFWPSLLRRRFLFSLVTPIVVASRKVSKTYEKKVSTRKKLVKNSRRETDYSFTEEEMDFSDYQQNEDAQNDGAYDVDQEAKILESIGTRIVEDGQERIKFYSLSEFEEFKFLLDRSPILSKQKWTFKYYKGLGTSNLREAREYFSNLEETLKPYKEMDEEDSSKIILAFDKSRASDRKLWLEKFFKPGLFLDFRMSEIRFSSFVDKELINFSMHDNLRSIPSFFDGLKPVQRKILFTLLSKAPASDRKELKVASLAAEVSQRTSYHHGEMSLQRAIIGLAQNFTGSNNINLLKPAGQFGSRNKLGKDFASARYIHSHLEPIARKIFIKQDLAILPPQEEDGEDIEPLYLAPIIPLAIINGAEGIGTGWATKIPPVDPRKVIRIYKDFLEKMVKDFDGIDKDYCLFRESFEINKELKVEVPKTWENFKKGLHEKSPSAKDKGVDEFAAQTVGAFWEKITDALNTYREAEEVLKGRTDDKGIQSRSKLEKRNK